MSELLSKEVEAIISGCIEALADKSLLYGIRADDEAIPIVRSALRSVLLLAAKEICEYCLIPPVPYGDKWLHDRLDDKGNHVVFRCSAAPIHKMLRGE